MFQSRPLNPARLDLTWAFPFPRRPNPGWHSTPRQSKLLKSLRRRPPLFRRKMQYKIATLLYCFNERDEVLLMHRVKEPNRGLWGPCGGKLKTDIGESPYACACREAFEELGLWVAPSAFHLTGIVSEHGYEGQAHWLMFLFELRDRLKDLPPVHSEGEFKFFHREELGKVAMPQTDREQIWPLFWKHRGGFFAAHCHCHSDGRNDWRIEESVHA